MNSQRVNYNTEEALNEIVYEIKEINSSLKTIADFFKKWTVFDNERPSIYVSADVKTHKG